jgi:hypothetical protein
MSSTEILDTLENEAQENNKQAIEKTTTSNKAVSIKHTMMKKSFYRLAIILILATALFSVGFTVAYYIADTRLANGESVAGIRLTLFYIKKFFDLLAVFTGYGSIIYAFSRYTSFDGIKILLVFGLSCFIAIIQQVIGTCVEYGIWSMDFVTLTFFLTLGLCLLNQFLPAIIIAYFSYRFTKNGTRRIEKFISFKNPTQKIMILTVIISFLVSAIFSFCADVIPLIADYLFYAEDLYAFLLDLLIMFIEYVVLQYIILMIVHYIYTHYTDKITPKNKK